MQHGVGFLRFEISTLLRSNADLLAARQIALSADACWALVHAARADEINQRTEISFRQPIEIPESVLPVGTYWFILSASPNRNIVRIYSENSPRPYPTCKRLIPCARNRLPERRSSLRDVHTKSGKFGNGITLALWSATSFCIG